MIATLALAAASWSIYVGGGVAMATPPWTATTTFTEFAEAARIETRALPRAGAGFEAGLWHAMTGPLGVTLTVTRAARDAAGRFTASLPHPLYVGRPRTAIGDASTGAQREIAVHFGLTGSATRGGVTMRLAAGPSYFLTRADVVESIAYEHEYPYDDVRVTAVRSAPVRGDAVGGHAELSLERRVARRLAIAAGARWSRAAIVLARAVDGTEIAARLRAGGLTASASIRLYF